jgi:hypothetical protein
MSSTISWPRLGLASLVLLGASLPCSQALAQSSYVLNTLVEPTADRVGGRMFASGQYDSQFGIDANDNVLGPAQYANGYYIDTNAPHIRRRYDKWLVQWPAGTASKANASKLIKAGDWTYMQLTFAPGARKVIIYSNGSAVYDADTRKLGSKLPGAYRGVAINDQGLVLWEEAISGFGATNYGTWSAAGSTTFPKVPDTYNTYTQVAAINLAGVVVGTSYSRDIVAETYDFRTITWSGNTMAVLDNRPDMLSQGLKINGSGQVLVSYHKRAECNAQYQCDVAPEYLGIFNGGEFTAINMPLVRDGNVTAGGLTNRGVVFGSYRLSDSGDGRGFIWQGGVFSDVTELVGKKGVSLPLGTVITDVLAMNEKGSMVVVTKSVRGVRGFARLVAKP